MKTETKLSDRKLLRLREFKAQADELVESIARERDKLRTLVEEYTDVLESCDEAAIDFEHGLDEISKFL